MIVYADILIVVNLIVDYFLLKVSGKILKIKPKMWRLLLSAFAGGIFSLYIFFPQRGILIELIVKLSMNSVMSLICFGFRSFKMFLKSSGVLFASTCIYAGIMIALWQILKPKGMVINNSVVYFDISPITLIITTVAGYFLYILFSKIFTSSSALAQRCEIKLWVEGKSVNATAIIDTGNSVKDVFSSSHIIIVDKAVISALFQNFGTEYKEKMQSRFRAIPCGTVSGGDLLEGYRCDAAEIFYENRVTKLNKPIAAISKLPLKENYSAIINPETLEIDGEENEQTEKLSV